MVTASLFASATDTSPHAQELDVIDFLKSFAEEPELVHGALELSEAERKRVKNEGRAWGGRFSGSRCKENFLDIACVVFDLDGDFKNGVDLGLVLQTLERWNVSYAVHSTFGSGFVAPFHKLRVIVPTNRPLNATEYAVFWDQLAPQLGADPATKNAERINFAPRIPAEHLGHYVCRVVTDRPLLAVSFSKSQPTSGRRNLNDVELGRAAGSKDWLSELETTESKNETLVRCAFRLGKLAALSGEGQDAATARVWAQCEGALKRNPSEVLDWSAAYDTCRRGVRNGFRAADEEANEDPLPPVADAPADKRLCDKADRDLAKFVKQLKNTPSVKLLERNAFLMGQHVATGAIDDETVRAMFSHAVADGELPAADISSTIETGLASGRAKRPSASQAWMNGLTPTKEGNFAASDKNVNVVLTAHPDCVGLLFTDTYSGTPMVSRMPPWECDTDTFPSPLLIDRDASSVMVWLSNLLRSDVSLHTAKEGLVAAAGKCEVNRFTDYLDSLTWDGTARLETWLSKYVGAKDDEYTRAVGRRWLVGAAARAFEPGCKFDNMLLFTGAQGIGKSTTFAALLPSSDLFTDKLPEDDKDCAVLLASKAIVEMSELSYARKRDRDHLKAFISSQTARVRPAYARVAQEFPRRAALVGSTNEASDFLDDPTGGRRFWVVTAGGQCDPGGVTAVRDQLWAEAVRLFRAGEPWWLSPTEEALAKEVQEIATFKDVFADKLEDYLENGIPESLCTTVAEDSGENYIELLDGQTDDGIPQFFTVEQVCTLFGMDLRRDQKRAAELLRSVGLKRGKREVVGGRKLQLYRRAQPDTFHEI